MRTKSVVDRQGNKRIFKYNIEAAVEEVKLNIRFPCKLSISWNYGEGSVTTIKPVALEKGVAKFDETLSYSTNISFDDQKQQYLEQRTTLQVFIITENGNSLAGFVTLDLGSLVGNQERKDTFQIERCPDRSATIRMKLLYRFVSQKVTKVSNETHSYERDNSINQLSEGLTKTEQYGRKNDQSTRNKELIERQLTLLKSRVSEYEGKYKNEKAERDKLNDLLKGKQQVYFTLKTQIKRRQIEMEGMARTLDEYRNEYERLKIQNDMLSKERERLQSSIEVIERSSYDKISRLESQNISSLKKIEKINLELERFKKDKDSMALSFRERSEGNNKDKQSLNESIRQLRKEKEDALKANRVEKQGYERSIRDLNRKIIEYEEQLNETKEKYSVVNKKMIKIEQLRMEEITRTNIRIAEIQKVRDTLSIELGTLKKDSHKKQHNLSDTVKNLQKQLNEERGNNTRVTKSMAQFQSEKATNSKQLERVRQINKIADEENKKLEKQIEHLKYQINGLNEIMLGKNSQLKSLLIKSKEVQQDFKNNITNREQKHIEDMEQFERQMKQLKKSEETKYLALTTNFVRKQRDLEDALVREQKLNMHVQILKQEYKKNQGLWKQKMQGLKKNQQQSKQEYFEYSKKKEDEVHDLVQKLREMELEIYSLNQSLSQIKDNEFRLLEREQRMRVEQQQLHALYSQLNLTTMRLRQELEECRDELQNNSKNQSQLNRQIESSEARYSKLVKELKQKLIELEAEKVKLQNSNREKQKLIDQTIKSSRQQLQSLKKQIHRKQLEVKKLQDENRQIGVRDKLKLDEMQMELEKTNNQLIRTQGTAERTKTLADQLETELRNFKQNFKFITREKEDLIRAKQEAEADKRDLEENRDSYEIVLNTKEKEMRSLRAKNDQIELQFKELQLVRTKSLPIIEELCQIVWRITGSQGAYQLVNEYDNMMEVRKGLLILETKMGKQHELHVEFENSSRKEGENHQVQVERLNNDIQKLRAHVSSLKNVEEDLATQINMLKLENQDLCYQINNLQTEVVSLKSTNSVLDTKLKDEYEHVHHYELQNKRVLEKYEGLLNQTRSQFSDKQQKQKKQLTATIRALQTKIEMLEQKNFSLELEGQKIQEYIRREEEGKKILARMYELERENIQLLQAQKDIDEKAMNEQGKLQWQKNSIQQSMKNTISRLEKTNTNLQGEVDKLTTKNRELFNTLKDKEASLEKVERNILTIQQQFTQQKNLLQEERDKILDSQSKLKNEIIKLKSQLTLVKKSYEQDKDKLFSLESVSLIKNELDFELQSKNAYIVELEDKQQKLNQEIFKMTQQIEQLKWDYNQTLSSKETQIMNIQEELYTLNSKENVRMLREAQFTEKHRQMEQQKKSLQREMQQYKDKYKVLAESQRSGDALRDIDRERGLMIQNQKKHDQIIKILQEQITNLKMESSMMKRQAL